MPQARLVSEAVTRIITPMAAELRQLKRDRRQSAAVMRVDADIAEGLVTPALRQWAVDCCHTQPRAYRQFLAVQRQLLEDDAGQAERAIFHNLNLTPEQLAAAKTKRQLMQQPPFKITEPEIDGRDTQYRGATPSSEMIDSVTDDECAKWLSPAEMSQCRMLSVSPRMYLKSKLAAAKTK